MVDYNSLAVLPFQSLYGTALALIFFIVWIITGLISIFIKFLSRESCNKPDSSADYLNYDSNPNASYIEQGSFYNHCLKSDSDSEKNYNTFPKSDSQIQAKKQPFTCLDYMSEMFSWIAYLSISAVSVCLSAFSVIPLWVSILTTFFLLLLKLNQNIHQIYVFESDEASPERKLLTLVESWRSMISKHSKLFILGVAFVAGTALIAPLITHKSCINDHTVGYGIPLAKGKFIYSSALYRYLTLDKVCKDEKPCHIYATVPFDTATSVFINVHTNINIKDITVNYEKSSVYAETGSLTNSQTSSYTINPDYDSTGERNIHNVLLQNLAPNELYTVEIFYNGKSQATTTYQTLPGPDSTEPYNLIYGGDAGYNHNSKQMTPVIANQNPRAIIIGGDIAYDDGAHNCYYTMDLFLSMIEKEINQKLGRLVPMILGVGNHDIGFNTMWNVKLDVNEKDGPSYFTNFPQHLPVNSKGQTENRPPKVAERNSYRAHMIGNLLNVVLDSAYMASYQGEQRKWLENISKNYKDHAKIAIYHDPIFPPCYHPRAGQNTTAAGIEHWVPVFTEYKYMAAFENHAHAYKRTFPMKGSKKADDGIGIVYLGDGAWGPDSSCRLKESGEEISKEIYESVSGVNNVWVVKVDPKNNKVNFEPIGLDNTPVDVVTVQNIENFVDL